MPQRYRQQQGVALISVLLIFALATVVAAEMMMRQFLDTRKVAGQLHSKQAYYYALGAESLARELLYRDLRSNRSSVQKVDALTDLWAGNAASFAIDSGKLSVNVIDAQGRFNLNNLLAQNGAIDGSQKAIFMRLLENLNLPVSYAHALADWLDADSVATQGGAEDAYYLGLDKPYRTANRSMADASELRLLKDMTTADYEKLKPFITTLPAPSSVNINTASTEVLRAIFQQLATSKASSIASEQKKGGFDSVSEFTQRYNVALPQGGIVSVNSEYFLATASVEFAELGKQINSLLYRDADTAKIAVIGRHYQWAE